MISRKILLLLILCIGHVYSEATVCADRFFFEQHVILGICKNHGRGLGKAALYYEGVAKALNDYIALRIERGELKDKKFDIYMLDPILTRPHIELVQNKKTYFIRSGEALSLQELMCLIDEFTQPDFTALDLGLWEYENETDYDRKSRQLERVKRRIFGKQLLEEDINTIRNREYVFHQQGKLKMIYQNDKVKYFIDNKEIEIDPIGLPSLVGDRYIFQECGVFKVYQDTTLVKTFRHSDEDEWDCEYIGADVYNKWVNFDTYGEYMYSYSYDKNRFYRIERKD